MIQILYTIEHDFDIIVFSAMFFSVLSLLISSLQQLARCLQQQGADSAAGSDMIVHETRYKINSHHKISYT